MRCLPCSAAAAVESVVLYPLMQMSLLTDSDCLHNVVNRPLFAPTAFEHTQEPSFHVLLQH